MDLQKKEIEQKCAVCNLNLKNSIDELSIWECSHKIHNKCYGNFINKTSKKIPFCPICNSELKKSEYFRLIGIQSLTCVML